MDDDREKSNLQNDDDDDDETAAHPSLINLRKFAILRTFSGFNIASSFILVVSRTRVAKVGLHSLFHSSRLSSSPITLTLRIFVTTQERLDSSSVGNWNFSVSPPILRKFSADMDYASIPL